MFNDRISKSTPSGKTSVVIEIVQKKVADTEQVNELMCVADMLRQMAKIIDEAIDATSGVKNA